MQKLTGHETKSLSRSLSRSTTFNSEKDLTLLEIVSFEINVKEKDSENRFGNSIFFSSKILCCMKNETITSSGPLKFCDTHGSLAFSIILANVESNWKGLV